MSESIEFQRYLESIRATYQEWWKFYTLTDAAGKQQRSKEVSPFFDFNLIVQTVKREERERQEEEIERFSVLEGLRMYADQQVLLVGRPGSGKSTALARLMLEEATNPQMGIPVLVELRYWQGSIEQLICNSLKRHGLTVERLEAVLSRLLLLFDGVNELPSEEARSQLFAFRRDHHTLPMIFTTRDLSLGGDLGIEKKLEMQPLSEVQMREFVRSYLSAEQAEKMLRQLNDRLREFGQTPLLLWMLCEVIKQMPDDRLPSNLAGIFQSFTTAYEISSVRRHEVAVLKGDVKPLSDRRIWKKALNALAFLMMQGKTPVDFRVVIDRDEAERELGRIFSTEQFPVRDILDDLLKYHLLQNRRANEIEFRHQLIQEYYAAEALLQQLHNLNDEQLKRKYLNFLKWTEPVALMLALVDERQALRVVKLVLEVDIQLGSRVAGAVKIVLAERAFQLIKQLSVSENVYILLLGKTHSDEVTEVLEAALKDPKLVKEAIEALGELSSSRALNILFHAVQQNIVEEYNCETIFEIFGRTIDQNTSDYLQQIVRYHSVPHIRAIAASKLKSFSSDDVIQTLYNAALDEHDYVSQKARSALWKIGSSKAVAAMEAAERILDGDMYSILEEMKDSDKFLGKFTGDLPHYDRTKIVSPPLTSVERLRRYLAQHFNFELDVDNRNFLLAVLERALDTPNANVRLLAIEALGEISDHRSVVLLSKALGDSNFDNRAHAAIALAELSDPAAIPALINAFHQEENIPGSGSYVRQTIIEALGDIGHADAIPFLKQLLENLEVDLFDTILEAIARIGSAESISFLYDILRSGKIKYTAAWMNRIQEIQIDCRYYNHEVYQDYLEAQKHDRQFPQNSDLSHIIINNYPNVTEVTQNIMSNSSKYNFPNAQKVQIFEQVNTYIENNHPTDPEIKTAIADLTLLLTNLQTQHPQVTTESQALTVLDAEFTEIQQSTTHPLITLRQQLLNPERHLQAIKATLAEVAKHYLEESVWAKAAITYFDKLSETPDQGA